MFILKFNIFSKAIFRASRKGNVNKLNQLIANGANVNIRGRGGLTPLMVASSGGKSVIVKMLIEHGATVNAQDNNGMTPLTHALQKTWFHRNLSRMINNIRVMASGDQSDAYRYYYPDKKNDNDVAELLISSRADVNLADSQNMTPLMYAVILGNEEIATMLLMRGANVNAKNNDGATPLMMAVLRGFSNLVNLLIEYDSDVNYRNNDGISVMTIALYKGNKDIVNLLMAKGAKEEVTNCLLKKL